MMPFLIIKMIMKIKMRRMKMN